MALEIERKWLVRQDSIPNLEGITGAYIEQAYVIDVSGVVLRVRSVKGYSGVAVGFVSVKSPSSEKGAVNEFEMEIPYEEACILIAACSKKLTKTRYYLPAGDLVIELDIFYDELSPLIVAEIEFPENYSGEFIRPTWFGREVTGVKGFSNASLIKKGLPENIQP